MSLCGTQRMGGWPAAGVTLVAWVVASCSSSAPQPTAIEPEAEPEPQWPVTLTIVSMNDFHGALYELPLRDDPTLAMGGLPWLVGAVESLRAESPDLLLLDGGDSFQGAWPVNATEGRGSVEAFNLLGVDAAAIGNHEFDYGAGGEGSDPLLGALQEAAQQAQFVWLTSNVYRRQPDGSAGERWQPEGIAPWTIIERSGVRVGIIGLTTADTPQTTTTRNVVDLVFGDVVAAVQDVLPAVQAAGADVTVIVGHLIGSCEAAGYLELGEPCTPEGELGALLTQLPPGSVDVIVAGHEHALMAFRHDDVFVLEARAQGHVLNRLDLVVGPDGAIPDASRLYPPWPLLHATVDPGCEEGDYDLTARQIGDHLVTPSGAALELVEGLESEAGSLCDEVGCSATHLSRASDRESAVGNLLADASLAEFPGADLAIQNGGGLRADLPEGTLRREDLQAVMPFDNRLLLVDISGESLLLLFRIGTSGAHSALQVAGVRYQYDPDRTGGTDIDGDGEVAQWETDRLCGVWMGDEPIDPARTYHLVLSDFLMGGGDHLAPALANATLVEQGDLAREALFEWVTAQSECLGEAAPLVEPDAPRVVLAPCQ